MDKGKKKVYEHEPIDGYNEQFFFLSFSLPLFLFYPKFYLASG